VPGPCGRRSASWKWLNWSWTVVIWLAKCGGRFMLDTVFRKQTNLARLTHREPSEDSWFSFTATNRNCAWSVADVFFSVLLWEMSHTVLTFSDPSFFKRKMNRLMWSPRCLSVCLSILTYFTKTARNFMILEAILWYWRPFCDTGCHFMILEAILWYWRPFYDHGGHFMILETILRH